MADNQKMAMKTKQVRRRLEWHHSAHKGEHLEEHREEREWMGE